MTPESGAHLFPDGASLPLSPEASSFPIICASREQLCPHGHPSFSPLPHEEADVALIIHCNQWAPCLLAPASGPSIFPFPVQHVQVVWGRRRTGPQLQVSWSSGTMVDSPLDVLDLVPTCIVNASEISQPAPSSFAYRNLWGHQGRRREIGS